jgi:hypothetical protein
VALQPVEPIASQTPSSSSLLAAPPAWPSAPPSYERLEDSDVFVCGPDRTKSEEAAPRSAREVTLFVHGWHNVEPGLLSWTFPDLRTALDAVKRMKNAIGWCVVSGSGWGDLEAARESGAVLVEQLS